MDAEIPQYKQLYNEFNGIRFSSRIPLNVIKDCLEHNAKSEIDVFIATRQKSGTALLSHIVYLIINNGNPGGTGFGFKFYEYNRSNFDFNTDTVRVMLTHLPINAIPHNNSNTKFIFLMRNPKDVAVSYYCMVKDDSKLDHKLDFHQFFKLWIDGEVPYGDYFDNIIEWFKYRNNPNYLFVIYENLIRNKKQEMERIAGFIDEKYRQNLAANDYNNTYMENVLKYSSFEHMKSQVTSLPFLMRKGLIGDWRNYLSEEESVIIDTKMSDKLGETDLVDVWKNDMLWQN